MPNLPISKEKQDLIQMLFQEGKSFKEIKNITKLNWRTIKKYANKPDKIYNSEKIKQIYLLTGSLVRVANILNISTTTVWRQLQKAKVKVGKGCSSWKKLYSSIRGRIKRSQWHKDILTKYNSKCIKCNTDSKTVHHLMKVSNLRDQIIKSHPEINPYNSRQEVKMFLDLVMKLHTPEIGVVLCHTCHSKEHSSKIRNRKLILTTD